jgi:hypothetical protein
MIKSTSKNSHHSGSLANNSGILEVKSKVSAFVLFLFVFCVYDEWHGTTPLRFYFQMSVEYETVCVSVCVCVCQQQVLLAFEKTQTQSLGIYIGICRDIRRGIFTRNGRFRT